VTTGHRPSDPRATRRSLIQPGVGPAQAGPEAPEDVSDDLARHAIAERGPSEVAHVVLALLIASLFWETPLRGDVLWWLGLVLFAVAGHALVRGHVRRRGVREGLRALRLGVGMVTVAWGLGPALVLDGASFSEFSLIMVVFAGIVAGGTGALAADRVSFYTLLAGLTGGLLAGLLVHEMRREFLVSIGLVVLFAAVVGAVFERSHQTLAAQLRGERKLRTREEETAREREYLAALLASAPTAIATVDGHGVVQDVNPAFERLFGYTLSDAQGTVIDDLLVAPEGKADAEALESRALSGEAVVAEVERRRKDGRLVPVRLSAARVRGIVDVAIFVLYDDISGMRRAQEALREAERQYRELVESASDLVWKADTQGRWEFLNEATRDIYGLGPEDLLGKPVFDVVDPAHQDRDRAAFRRVLGGEELTDHETVHRDVHDVPRHLSFAARPVHDASGQVIGAHGTARDVTERAQARAALVEAREAAERAAALRSAFVANMSHEIRTPLNGILGLVDLMLDGELTAEHRRFAELIRTSGEALLSVINDVLDFSKIEAGRMELEEVGFDLPGLVESTARLLAVRAAGRGLDVLVDVAPDVPHAVVGDPGRLRQVLTNLVGNAIKFTTEGEIVVSVSREPNAGDAPRLRFAVRDTGIGIPADRMEAIFEEFTQADTSTSRQYGGTGLGLALCRRLVARMHGALEATSTVGTGSEFSFIIPLPTRAVEEPSTVAGVAPHIPPGARALIVDDSTANRRIVREMLRLVGMQVDEAADADAGMARLRAATATGDPYAVVILDGHMPGRDGFAFAADVRADPQLSAAPLLMLTSASSRGDGQRCRDMGIDGYLTKPVVRVEFLEAITAVIGGDKARRPDPLVTRHSMLENREHLRVLLAEDNRVNQQVAMALLQRRGHDVDVVENGALAVDAVRATPYDVVLMDLEMPVMDGLTATRTIRGIPGCETLPIVALTAHAMSESRDRCLAAGMNACVVKPFRPHELFAATEGWGLASPPPLVPDAGQVVNLGGLRRALQEAGAEDVMDDVLQVFQTDAPGRLAAIDAAVELDDMGAVGRAAHAYKSAASTIQAGALAEVLQQLERAGKEADGGTVTQLVPQVRRAHEAVMHELAIREADVHG